MSGTLQAKRLLGLLRQHGVSNSSASGLAAWTAFKEYGREVFGPESVGLLFQVGVYTFTGAPLFYFDPLCQFEFTDKDGEHDHFEQLHCELTCPASDSLKSVKTSLWSFDYPAADDFFAAVEALPEFQAAIEQPAYNMAVTHETV